MLAQSQQVVVQKMLHQIIPSDRFQNLPAYRCS
jgi:hypothetical protein